MEHIISREWLSLAKVKEIIDNHAKLALSEQSKADILKCRSYLDSKM